MTTRTPIEQLTDRLQLLAAGCNPATGDLIHQAATKLLDLHQAGTLMADICHQLIDGTSVATSEIRAAHLTWEDAQ